jgi:molybdopterin-containing oxidoreductase family iron-sulfur binding subunit
MDKTRRDFLKIAGLSALGVGVKPVSDAMAEQTAGPDVKDYKEPLTAERWAMVINLKKFKENPDLVQKCVEACHKVHNVPEFENKKDEVKWIWSTEFGHAFPSQEHEYLHEYAEHGLKVPVLVLCNQCDNPPCVRVCPTKATFQAKDGIVMMDYHRCIGCRFCLAACPYGARSLNWRDPRGVDKDGKPFIKELNREFPTRTRGVVEKCNFCAERLAKGLQPACVEVCENGEMLFGAMDDAESPVRKALAENFALRRKPQLGTKPQVYYIV